MREIIKFCCLIIEYPASYNYVFFELGFTDEKFDFNNMFNKCFLNNYQKLLLTFIKLWKLKFKIHETKLDTLILFVGLSTILKKIVMLPMGQVLEVVVCCDCSGM